MTRNFVIVLVLALAAATFASLVSATAPGNNGRIAFRRYFDTAHTWGAVFTINADGTGERRVTQPAKGVVDDQPDWSPDGSLLVFSRCSERAACGLYSVRPDGTRLTRLTRPCPPNKRPPNCEGHFVPTFSPDGRHIAFSRYSDEKGSAIELIDLQGGDRRVLVEVHRPLEMGDPQFSPDGKRLVVQQLREPGESVRTLFIVNADGTGLRRLIPWRLSAGDNPDWSPNGKWILFRSNVERDNKQSQIYLVHPDGTGLKQLTHFKAGTIVTSSSFSPDGKWIVFATSGLGGNADLFVMRPDGTRRHTVTRTKAWDSAPDWGPAR